MRQTIQTRKSKLLGNQVQYAIEQHLGVHRPTAKADLELPFDARVNFVVVSFLRSIDARFRSLVAWWTKSGRRFVIAQWKRLTVGCALGCFIAILIHLVSRDKVFAPILRTKWQSWSAHSKFEGLSAYRPELYFLGAVCGVAIIVRIAPSMWRYLRAWWAGITSLTGMLILALTVRLLWPKPVLSVSTYTLALSLVVLLGIELWRFEAAISFGDSQPRPSSPVIFPSKLNSTVRREWLASTGDDPIQEWDEDLIGRSSIIEVLTEHIFVRRSPIVALHGGLGDGKTSVLNLLQRALKGHAIVVPFSAWLPGSDETLAIDLFRDIATGCKRILYIPQLKKQSAAYARTISGSVSSLAFLKEILPTRSQREEIDEIRETLARVPLPVVVLLDEVDRMQKNELLVLLKILRGASSIPNVTFICAFSEEEMKKHLSTDGALSYDYLEKFFPVTVSLAPPDPAMVGRLFQGQVKTAASAGGWFLATDQQKFGEALDLLWRESLSRICSNFRKAGLLLNDVKTSAHSIGGEVNILDLVAIEALRRFAPEIYQLVRRNSVLLTYGNVSLTSDQYISDRRKQTEGGDFFQKLDDQVAAAFEPRAIKNILDFLFPNADRSKGAFSTLRFMRPGGEEVAEKEKRICSPDYFSVYFRSAIPEEMYSEAELAVTIETLNNARSEVQCELVLKETLAAFPKPHPKREDFLWKLGRNVQRRLNDNSAEWLAYAAASRATDYSYDLMNIGEAARALNLVFEAAQKLSSSSRAQEILVGAMKRATDDTFAFRLWEFIEKRDRNKILVNFDHINPQSVKAAFMERMRMRYGQGIDISAVDIAKGEWWAFRTWADNSEDDKKAVEDFWRRYIGTNRKKLAQAINFLYPKGYSWSEDPRPFISTVFPVGELQRLAETLTDGPPLDENEANAFVRFGDLLNGKWFNIARPDA